MTSVFAFLRCFSSALRSIELAADRGFDSLVSEVEHRYDVHARVPMMSFVSLCARFAHGAASLFV